MTDSEIDQKLSSILRKYKENFSTKVYVDNYDSTDILMETFGITQDLKRENKQFWGRQLGMCWQFLVVELCKYTCFNYGDALRFGVDEPCDLILGNDAIDTKYRVGSGDSGTLKKFKQYGELLTQNGYRPVFLFVREDNLPAAMTACKVGGWSSYTGYSAFAYLQKKTGFDLYGWLCYHKYQGTFLINRSDL
ncbi:MAG: hypothetical protein KAH77_00805 [Thiomargarita sp.]|nr:hypothetical protein [Thiomargarita sp.]